MNLLVKFPTRERPARFLQVLALYYASLDELENVEFVVSCDLDDPTMNNDQVRDSLRAFPRLTVCYGHNQTKVEAINADLAGCQFDILLLASDDMTPQVKGYDGILRSQMAACYPDGDGVLFFNDGRVGRVLNTMAILGRRYYDRFGYIYHPAYTSLWCDNEFMEVADRLQRQTFFEQVLFRHDHPAYPGINFVRDPLGLKNDSFYQSDRVIYESRKRNGFK